MRPIALPVKARSHAGRVWYEIGKRLDGGGRSVNAARNRRLSCIASLRMARARSIVAGVIVRPVETSRPFASTFATTAGSCTERFSDQARDSTPSTRDTRILTSASVMDDLLDPVWSRRRERLPDTPAVGLPRDRSDGDTPR